MAVSVPEAARQLGISERAVRFRITSGSLAATRTAQGWQVALPAEEQGGSEAVAEGGSPETTEAVGGNGAVGQGGSEGGKAVEPTALALALAEVTFLRGEVEALQERLREAHVLLAQRPALPAPASVQADPPDSPPADPPRPWWAALLWWRR